MGTVYTYHSTWLLPLSEKKKKKNVDSHNKIHSQRIQLHLFSLTLGQLEIEI